MSSYGWLFDPKRCIQCSACEAACKQWNGVATGVGIRYRRVSSQELGSYPAVRLVPISMACNHCENPLCKKACPAKAITQRADGIILVDQQKCLGCGMCAKFCPYDAPQYHKETRKMQKCTMCVERVDAGLQPACASACPTGALRWGKWEDDIALRGAAWAEGFKTPATTRPRLRIMTGAWGAR